MSCVPLSPLPSVSTVWASTLTTPRCWNCAPSDRNTAPMRASGIPMNCVGSSGMSSVSSPRSGSTTSTLPARPSISLANGRPPDPNHGDPVLHAPASPVGRIDDDVRALVRDMFETMDAAPGVGLAARRSASRSACSRTLDRRGGCGGAASPSIRNCGSPRRSPACPTRTTSPRAACRSPASGSGVRRRAGDPPRHRPRGRVVRDRRRRMARAHLPARVRPPRRRPVHGPPRRPRPAHRAEAHEEARLGRPGSS